MTVYRSLDSVPPEFGPCALTIGNFDGVHRGHRRILRRVAEVAAASGWKPAALLFDPHPTRIVAPARTPPLMTTPRERTGLMRGEGIAQALILPFTPEVARLSPEEFVRDIVAARLKARAVLVGDNFRFGHEHAGDARTLAELGRKYGFETETIPAAMCRGRVVSSSAVRELVRAGRVAMAARYLERPYALEGPVVSGRGVGSRQTVPTLNLAAACEVIPAPGVYVTRTRDLGDARVWDSITNVGYRPTFGHSDELTVETYLLDPLEGETPARIRVEFLAAVRKEKKFDSPEALKQRILRDVGAAKRYFRRCQSWTGRSLAV